MLEKLTSILPDVVWSFIHWLQINLDQKVGFGYLSEDLINFLYTLLYIFSLLDIECVEVELKGFFLDSSFLQDSSLVDWNVWLNYNWLTLKAILGKYQKISCYEDCVNFHCVSIQ